MPSEFVLQIMSGCFFMAGSACFLLSVLVQR